MTLVYVDKFGDLWCFYFIKIKAIQWEFDNGNQFVWFRKHQHRDAFIEGMGMELLGEL
jgi:hypothetical protein